MKKNQRGFSLVELLIVVAIIGIIAAIAIPSLLAARRASNEAAAVADLRTLGSAEATYLAQTGKSGNFTNLKAGSNLDSQWSTNSVRDSYAFTDSAGGTDGRFYFTAAPAGGSLSQGTKSYSIIEDYVIRFTSGTTAPGSGSGSPIGT